MQNLNITNSDHAEEQNGFEKNKLSESDTLNPEGILAEQGSEEQRMKEKYISEVSKIEDAPGDGGTESDSNEGKD